MSSTPPPPDVERAVRKRYTEAATARAGDLCCAVTYDSRYLAVIPDEILERDYGCGDPSRHLRPGETVLDLGSGGGKICYIASQRVGRGGRVIGVDANDAMLALAERHRVDIGDRIGYHNVTFHKGRIQDLALDLRKLEARLAERPVSTPDELAALEDWIREMRRSHPMIPSASVDVVISNCVLNLVHHDHRRRLFAEIHRVLKDGARAVISDIVSDRDVPDPLRSDADSWSGCISGAFREDRFLDAFADAGFGEARVVARGSRPWKKVEGVEFRSLTVEAFKGEDGRRDAGDRAAESGTPCCGPARGG